ncbi:N-acetylmuramoyl-L-alanine amidase [Microbulbifer rhizosphaerae]|uniref:N-acetylmuramoyl-L-alanine amidase n=1 Tax=Microbulbifer rhizosphaerae TaxID=1562603 RepID=A0A7W4Z7J3_9GAMM|nr:peptidoglycan recognition family protein [Microbulbifer rhizosphaerae]MBB3059803.1 hypothetical protein [Microbulbifer rhizosphaerae]
MLRNTMLGALAAGLMSLTAAASAQEMNRELAEMAALEEQQLVEARAAYPQYFAEAYARYPEIPRGILEAIAWSKSRWQHLVPAEKQEPHHRMPSAYGVMGLYGGDGFVDQVGEAARLLLVDRAAIIADPRMNILAAAALLADEIYWQAAVIKTPEDMAPILARFAGFPSEKEKSAVDDFARDSFAFDVLLSLERGVKDKGAVVPKIPVAWKQAFDRSTLVRMRAPFVRLDVSRDHIEASGATIDPTTGIVKRDTEGELAVQSTDYGPAIWNPAHTSNFTATRNSAVSAVTIHTTDGNYAGAISWFKDPEADVSAHYVIRSSDGQVTQMVREAHRAWHVRGGHNDYTIGIEHEAFVDNSAWYTSAMYRSSAALVRNLCSKYSGISCSSAYDGPSHRGVVVLPTSIRIKGHQHYSGNNHVDPGIYWNWSSYHSLLNGGDGGGDGGGGGNPYTPAEACGSGFNVINSHTLSGGKIYLLWNGSSGQNCVVTMKSSDIGSPSSVSASLQVEGGTKTTDSGNFSYYAGPIKQSASNDCVKWGGSVGNSSWESPFEHCGS